MNELLIIVAIIFILCAIIGFSKGFVKIAASLATMLVTVVLVVFLTPYVSDVLMKSLPIEKMVRENVIELFLDDAEQMEASRDAQIMAIENSKLPEVFQQVLLENNNSEIYKMLGVTTFAEYSCKYLAKFIANVMAFLLTLIVVTLVVQIVLYTLGIISNLPAIGGLNRLAGGVLGLGIGLIIVWAFMLLITLLYNSHFGQTCFANISDNEFLAFLYENNPLLNYTIKFRG